MESHFTERFSRVVRMIQYVIMMRDMRCVKIRQKDKTYYETFTLNCFSRAIFHVTRQLCRFGLSQDFFNALTRMDHHHHHQAIISVSTVLSLRSNSFNVDTIIFDLNFCDGIRLFHVSLLLHTPWLLAVIHCK